MFMHRLKILNPILKCLILPKYKKFLKVKKGTRGNSFQELLITKINTRGAQTQCMRACRE